MHECNVHICCLYFVTSNPGILQCGVTEEDSDWLGSSTVPIPRKYGREGTRGRAARL
jgi:hypothetical protein